MRRLTLHPGRPAGRLFYCLISVLVAVGVSRGAPPPPTPPATTTISDVIYRADGSTAAGTLLITWPAFTTADQHAVPAGSMSLAIGPFGVINLALVPNQDATPAGTYYKVVMKLNDGTTSEEFWVVPTLSPTTISAIRSQVVPAGVALQVASRQYVDSAIAAAVGGTGGIRICEKYSGSDASAKIAACMADLPATGGTADARGLLGAQSWSTDPFLGVTKPVTLLIGASTNTLSVDITTPANIRVDVARGGSFSPAGGKTLTFGGSVVAGPYSTFSGAGTVVFSTSASPAIEAYPEWWGAVRDDGLDDVAAINAAISSNAKRIHFLPGVYGISSAILISKPNVHLLGDKNGTYIDPIPSSFAGTNYLVNATVASAAGSLGLVMERLRFHSSDSWTGGGFQAGVGGTIGCVDSVLQDTWWDLTVNSGDIMNISVANCKLVNTAVDLSGGPIRVYFGSSGSFTNTVFSTHRKDGFVFEGGEVKSISTISRTSNVTTVGITGHGYAVDQLVTIRGVADTTYNGRFRIASVTANDFTYSNPGGNGSSSGGTAVMSDVVGMLVDGVQVYQLRGAAAAQGATSVIKATGVEALTVKNVQFISYDTSIASNERPNLVRIENSTNVSLDDLWARDRLIGGTSHVYSLAFIDSSQVRASRLWGYQLGLGVQVQGTDNDITIEDSSFERTQNYDLYVPAGTVTGKLKVSGSSFARSVSNTLRNESTGTSALDTEFRNNRIEDPIFNGAGALNALEPNFASGNAAGKFDLLGNRFLRSSANTWTGFFVDVAGVTAEQKMDGNIFPTSGNKITGANAATRFGHNVGLNGSEEWEAKAGIFDAVTGYRIGGAATSGNVLRGNGTNFVSAQLAFSDLSGAAAATQGGTGQNSSASTGVPRVAGGTWSFDAGIPHLASSTSANLASVLSDETGAGQAMFNETPALKSYTVAGLPAAGTADRIAIVTDAASTGSCTSGGGSSRVLCRDTGTAWEPLGDGGSGGGGGANTALSNLASVAVNAGVIPGADGTLDLGSTALGWKNLYAKGVAKVGPAVSSFSAISQALLNLSNDYAATLNPGTTTVAFSGLSEDNTTSNVFGLYGTAVATHATGNRTNVFGVSGNAYHTSAGTVSYLTGVSGEAYPWGSANITAVSGTSGYIQINTTGGTITDAIQLWASGSVKTAGTVTNNYGLKVEDQAMSGANNYAIKSGAGLVDFGDTTRAPIFDATTGFRLAGGAVSGNVLRGNGTNFVSSALACADVTNCAALVASGTAGAGPSKAGTASAASRSDHDHRSFATLTWYFPGTPATGVSPMILAVPQGIVNGTITGMQVTVATTSASSSSFNLQRCTANCIGTSPTFSNVYSSDNTLSANTSEADFGSTNLTTTLNAKDQFKVNLVTIGSGLANVTITLTYKYDTTN